MTLSSSTTKVAYNGDGATVVFSVTFKFLANAHVQAILRDAAGGETAWVEGTHYSLAGAGNDAGGTLTVITSPTDYTPQMGERLTIRRVAPETQGTSLPAGGAFPSSSVEQMVDLLTMLMQQHSEEIARAAVLAATSQTTGLVLPEPAANAVLAWNAGGDNLTNLATTGLTIAELLLDTSPQLGGALDANGHAIDMDGNPLLLDPGGDTSITADTDDRIDLRLGGVDLFRFDGQAASLVNGLDFLGSITNVGTGVGPIIRAVGSDADIAIILEPKGLGNVKARCHNFVIEETDDGAATGPIVDVVRFSTSPAASDSIGSLKFRANNDAAPQEVADYGEVVGVILDPTDGSEDGRVDIRTLVAGVADARLRVGAGVFTKNAVGGDKGADSINASEIYENNVRVATSSGTTGGAGSAGAGNQFVELSIGGTIYKVLHDGTV